MLASISPLTQRLPDRTTLPLERVQSWKASFTRAVMAVKSAQPLTLAFFTLAVMVVMAAGVRLSCRSWANSSFATSSAVFFSIVSALDLPFPAPNAVSPT